MASRALLDGHGKHPDPPTPQEKRAGGPPSEGVTTLFDHIRNQLRLAITLPYLIYAVIFSLLDRVEVYELVSSPLYQMAWVCLIIAILTVAKRIEGAWPNLVVQASMVPLRIYAGFTQISSSPLSLQVAFLFWCTLALLPLFLHSGLKFGTFGALTVVASLLGGVLSGRLGNGSREMFLIWTTGLAAMATVSVLGYIIMRFIEQNLILHEQASGQLKAARLDALTGLPNRAALELEFQQAINRANEKRLPLSIIVADIDHFKQVNDVHGHGTGDDVLRAFAKRLRRNVGTAGTVSRWGGEEFLVLLPATSREDAFAIAERLRRTVSESPIASLTVTASFGVASLRPPHDTLEQLFARADERLYEAKNAGRNAVR